MTERYKITRIVFYGVANRVLRNKAERYIDANCQIVGYCDSFYKEDILQGNRFIPMEELSKEEFDYVVILCASESNRTEIKERLIKLGISEEKIVGVPLLCKEDIYYSPDLLLELKSHLYELKQDEMENSIDGIFGMSYSLMGIDEKNLKGNFYNFSWHGSDLYYNYRLLKEAGKINRALLCLPYFYFDWDMSRSTAMVHGANVWALRGFEDWHNAYKQKSNIEYLINYELFGKKLFAEIGGKKFCAVHEETIQEEDNNLHIGRVWKRKYEETYEENFLIMDKMLALLTKMKSEIIIIVPPHLYIPGINKDDFSYIEVVRDRFYGVIKQFQNKWEFKIVDAFEILQEKRYWYDKSHLNESGRRAFTEYINSIL